MTNEELAQKFRNNANGVLTKDKTERLIDAVWNLERFESVASAISLAGTGNG